MWNSGRQAPLTPIFLLFIPQSIKSLKSRSKHKYSTRSSAPAWAPPSPPHQHKVVQQPKKNNSEEKVFVLPFSAALGIPRETP